MRFGDALNNGIFLSWHYLVENPESKVLGTIWKRIEVRKLKCRMLKIITVSRI